MNEEELWNWMMEGNYPPGYPNFDRPELVSLERRALATLARDITVQKWQGWGRPELSAKWAAGTRVKVVMASRLGDVGITDDLNAHNGYHHRVECVPRGNLLVDIEPIEDPRTDKIRLAFPPQVSMVIRPTGGGPYIRLSPCNRDKILKCDFAGRFKKIYVKYVNGFYREDPSGTEMLDVTSVWRALTWD